MTLYHRACKTCLDLDGGNAGALELAILSEIRAAGGSATYEDLLDRMPYLTERTLQRSLPRLIASGQLKVDEVTGDEFTEPRKRFVTPSRYN